MNEKRIVGIDVGSYAVKVVYLEPKGEPAVLGFDRERVIERVAEDVTPPPIPGDADDTQPRDADPFEEPFDDEPTGVHRASDEDAADAVAESAEIVALDAGPAWRSALARLGARGGLEGEYLVTFVPDGKAMTVQVPVPFEERAKVESVLPHLMVDRLPIDQSQLVWDFQVYPRRAPVEETEEEGGAVAYVGFAQNDDIARSLEHLHDASVDPVILGIPELLLASVGLRAIGGAAQVPVAFVDMGHETTRVIVVVDRQPILARSIRTGGRAITEALAEAFSTDVSEAEEIKHQYAAIVDEATSQNEQMRVLSRTIREAMRPVVRDLRRTLQGAYAREKVEVSRVLICGGTSQIRNIEGFLSSELGVPVKRMGRAPGGLDPAKEPGMELAFGAALAYQVEGIRARTINLRRGRFAYRGRSSYLRRQLAVFAMAAAGLLVVLGVSLYTQKQSYEAQRDAMRAALAEQTKSLFGTELLSKAQIEKVMSGEDASANSFVPNMSAYQLLHEISTKVSNDITISLDRIEVDSDRNLIQIYGETTDAPAVDRIVSDLRTIECFKEVKPDRVRVRDDSADFEIQISSGCS